MVIGLIRYYNVSGHNTSSYIAILLALSCMLHGHNNINDHVMQESTITQNIMSFVNTSYRWMHGIVGWAYILYCDLATCIDS